MYLRDTQNTKVIELHEFCSHSSSDSPDLMVAPKLRVYLLRTFVMVIFDRGEHVNRANVVKPRFQKRGA